MILKSNEEILDGQEWFPAKAVNSTQRLIILKAMNEAVAQGVKYTLERVAEKSEIGYYDTNDGFVVTKSYPCIDKDSILSLEESILSELNK